MSHIFASVFKFTLAVASEKSWHVDYVLLRNNWRERVGSGDGLLTFQTRDFELDEKA